MSAPPFAPVDPSRKRNTGRLLTLIVVVGVVVLLVANAHLLYVAFSSQPACVTHIDGEGQPGTYRAAKSAC
ncbi:hypothetical protein [Devosia psychrophila]|jgi:flagellar basal body-associated protein FliL|uniref:Uncharacterized protein n=1 Tax=Devosia psychrophila TaxID=728005 RepID=A0A1I1MXU9_9HYPH|nr:hypothetical protein [Devosia psychrophila]SFC89995.1 hypothetical protein SAMN04488059_11414 [Devosia psychrophila]